MRGEGESPIEAVGAAEFESKDVDDRVTIIDALELLDSDALFDTLPLDVKVTSATVVEGVAEASGDVLRDSAPVKEGMSDFVARGDAVALNDNAELRENEGLDEYRLEYEEEDEIEGH